MSVGPPRKGRAFAWRRCCSRTPRFRTGMSYAEVRASPPFVLRCVALCSGGIAWRVCVAQRRLARSRTGARGASWVSRWWGCVLQDVTKITDVCVWGYTGVRWCQLRWWSRNGVRVGRVSALAFGQRSKCKIYGTIRSHCKEAFCIVAMAMQALCSLSHEGHCTLVRKLHSTILRCHAR
eukprot:jgi/Ulvmu1/12225/UM086_0015.1